MRILAALLLVVALAYGEAHAAIRVDMQTAAAATADGKSMSVDDKGAAGLTVTGTFTATITFEGSADGGTTWTALSCIRLSTVVATTTTTTTGQFVCNVGGLSHLRARVSAYTDGSVTVVGTPSMASTAGVGAGTSGLTFDSNGNLNVNLNTLLAGEDQTANVLRVEGQFSYSGNKTADTQVKASAGYVHNLVCIGTDAAATAGTIILYDNTAESGTVVMSWAVQAAAYAQPVVFPLDVVMTTGIYLGFTTTADVTCTVSYR